MAQSIAVAMQLRLPGTAGRVGRKMRYIDEVAPRFRAGGLMRDVPEARHTGMCPLIGVLRRRAGCVTSPWAPSLPFGTFGQGRIRIQPRHLRQGGPSQSCLILCYLSSILLYTYLLKDWGNLLPHG